MAETRQMKIPLAAGIWAGVCLVEAFAGAWRGLGGRAFAVALAAFGAFFAVQVGLAAEGAVEWSAARLAAFRGVLPLAPFLVYLAYAVGTGQFQWTLTGLALAYSLIPAILLWSAKDQPKGCWQDYAAVLAIWLPAEFHLLQTAFPYPPGGLAHPLWASYAIAVGLIAFLLVRRLEGVGYRVAWGKGWGMAVGVNFLWFAAVAAVLGPAIGFIHFGPSPNRLKILPLVVVGILLFNAWPEEFLFRGLIQNLLSTRLGSDTAGLLAASVIFGLAHLNNGGFPNWRYALMATLAGLAYGSAWRKTRSIFASALVHAMVNVTWIFLFRKV
jgi:membrane protease YdiL (CAAX protease family)